MNAYVAQLSKPSAEELWKLIGGDKKGFVTI
jgi:hypothetical protein